MHEGGLFTQNFDILVYGPLREKFVEFANINDEDSVIYTTKKVQPKPTTTTNRAETTNTTAKTDELHKIHSTYYTKVNKMQSLPDENKSPNKTSTESTIKQDSDETGPFYFTWGDFKKTTTTISTANFWINANFCLVSDMLLDPYVNSVLSGNYNQLIITFNPNDKESCKKAVNLYTRLQSEKPPSQIKYQSQRLLLQQGYYHSYNENIVLALCESPKLEPLGSCLLIGLGEKPKKDVMDQVLKEMNVKNSPKIIIVDESNLEECAQRVVESYEWMLEAHQRMKGSLNLKEEHNKEIAEAVRSSFLAKHTVEKQGCSIF